MSIRRRAAGGMLTGVALLALFALSCSKKESFYPAQGLGVDSLFADSTFSNTEERSFNRGRSAGISRSSRRLVVCNWRGFTSRAFLRFSTLPDSAVAVSDASLFLYAARVDGATEVPLGIYSLSDTLDQNDLYWGNMPALGDRIAIIGSPAQAGDSATADLTALVSAWSRKQTPNLGIAVRLEDESAYEAMIEFASREALPKSVASEEDTTELDMRPALRIAYTDTAGRDTSVVYRVSEDAFADTLKVAFPEGLLVCGNGYPSRTFVEFDISPVPREATVIKAVLHLRADLEQSSFDSMGVICHALLDSASGFGAGYGLKGTGLTSLEWHEVSADPGIDMVVTPLLHALVARQVANHGFVIKSSDESLDLDYVVFGRRTDPDPGARPMLEIHYLLPPEPWYRRE